MPQINGGDDPGQPDEGAIAAAASDADASTAGTPQAEGQAEPEAATLESAPEEEDFLTPDEQAAIEKKTGGDVERTRKELVRAWNRKVQAIAQDRKFLETLRADPRGTVAALARAVGLGPQELTQQTQQQQTQQSAQTQAVDEALQALTPVLGPELARQLLPALQKVAETTAARLLGPTQQQQERMLAESADRETRAVLDAFTVKRPDWRQHEVRMVELSRKMQPGPDTTEAEYLEQLYALATVGKGQAAATSRAVEKIAQAAKSEPPPKAVSSTRITTAPARPLTVKEAFELAKQGIRVGE